MRPDRAALAAVFLAHALLIAGLVWWCWPLWGVLLALPLLATLPGLLRARSYTAAWASMLLVFYVAGLLSEATAMPLRRGVAHALALVAALDFVSLVAFVRLSRRAREAQAVRTESSAGAAH
jgi:uncharacterized membrane protein